MAIGQRYLQAPLHISFNFVHFQNPWNLEERHSEKNVFCWMKLWKELFQKFTTLWLLHRVFLHKRYIK